MGQQKRTNRDPESQSSPLTKQAWLFTQRCPGIAPAKSFANA